MKSYAIHERVDMVLCIGECLENCLLASKVYAQKYPDRRHPQKEVFERLLNRFHATGNVAYEKVNKNKTVIGDNVNELDVLLSVTENPNISTRKISVELEISQTSVCRILKTNHFHPYHIQLHQHLTEQDYGNRLNFCLWTLDKVGEDPDFFKNVLFTDESTFHNNGLVNRHNFHYYDTENKHLFRTVDRQHRWSVNVWGGIMGEYVIGPYFFDEHLNGRNFLNFLKQDFWTLLENLPLSLRTKMWLQLDGAPAHFSHDVRNYLNRKFTNRWIGRGGSYNWPARSPGLTKMDFFKWGYIKNIVYAIPPTTRDDMKLRITNAFASITPAMLNNVNKSFEDRIACCIAKDGKHFEHLLHT